MSTETIANLSGVLTVGVIMTIGLVARGAPPARRIIGETPLPSSPRSFRSNAIAGIAALAVTLAVAGPLATMLLVAIGGIWWARRRARSSRAAGAAVEATFPDAVELLVLCLHAGRSPVQSIHELAVRAPAPVRPGFAAVVARMARGAALADALAALPETLGPCAREVATSVAAADREGLALAPVLDRLAADARTARRRQGEAAARRLPVRLSFPLVACTLPAFVLLALAPALLGALSTLRGGAP